MHGIVNFEVVFYIFCVLWQNVICIFGGFHIGIAACAENKKPQTIKKRGSDIGTLKDQSCMSACSSIEKKHKTDDPFDLLWLLMQESEKQILKLVGTEPMQIKLTHRK